MKINESTNSSQMFKVSIIFALYIFSRESISNILTLAMGESEKNSLLKIHSTESTGVLFA